MVFSPHFSKCNTIPINFPYKAELEMIRFQSGLCTCFQTRQFFAPLRDGWRTRGKMRDYWYPSITPCYPPTSPSMPGDSTRLLTCSLGPHPPPLLQMPELQVRRHNSSPRTVKGHGKWQKELAEGVGAQSHSHWLRNCPLFG